MADLTRLRASLNAVTEAANRATDVILASDGPNIAQSDLDALADQAQASADKLTAALGATPPPTTPVIPVAVTPEPTPAVAGTVEI